MMKVMRDPVQYWAGFKKEMQVNLDYLQNFDLEKATNLELVEHMEKTWTIAEKHLKIHFQVMYPFLAAYVMLEQMCQELFRMDDHNPDFLKLMRGFDSLVYSIDRKLWELAGRAKGLGLDPVFENVAGKALLDELKKSEKGRVWCEEFESFLKKYGFRNETFTDPSYPSWIEDPSTPLIHIKGFLARTDIFNLDAVRKRQILERKKQEKHFISRVPKGKERMGFVDILGAMILSWRFKTWVKNKEALKFAALLGTGQQFGVFNEEHNLYIEQSFAVGFRMIAKETGKRLVKAGALDDPEDVFYLRYPEVRRYLLKAEWYDCRPLAAKRRAEFKPGGPPYIGDPTTVEMDLALSKIVGVVARGAGTTGGKDADLVGIGACPGVSEGPARLISATSELNSVQEGEILVVDTVWTTWTPVFSRIKGLVTNIGGTLSHGAIVAREYDVPAVLATREATTKLRTGQRLRVDGTRGTVKILPEGPDKS
jgi:pyruvate,water dikinase